MTMMKRAYQNQKSITLSQKKKYLMDIIKNNHLQEEVACCFCEKELNGIMQKQDISHQIFIAALRHLYQVKNFKEMENDLVIMNSLFSHQEYYQLKEEIFSKITKKTITLQEYCVIRYLIPFESLSFSQIMKILYQKYHVEAIECAKICLIEDHPHMAYEYLLTLDDCSDEALLNLLRSYSMKDYLSLLHHYTKKKTYQLAISH